MVDILLHRILRIAVHTSVIAGVSLACAGADQARAAEIDRLWSAGHFANRPLEIYRADAKVRRIRFLTSNYSRGPHTSALLPRVREVPQLVQGIKITPTSATWKMDGLKPQLVGLLARVQLHFGEPLHIVSGCRSKAHNRRISGARRSQHLHCNAADFEIFGVPKYELATYLKQMSGRGGVGVYCGSSYVHLDIGPKRQWHWSCAKPKRHKKHRARKKQAGLNQKSKRRRADRKTSTGRTSRRSWIAKIDQ